MPLGGLIYPQLPPTRIADPQLTPTPNGPPAPVNTPLPLPWCTPTPAPANNDPTPPPTPTASAGSGGAATDGSGVMSLSVSPESQHLQAVTTGPDGRSVIAWQEGGVIFLSTSQGQTLASAHPVALGEQATLAFSRAGRLHLAYVRNGTIYYRAARDINALDRAAEDTIGAGSNPQLIVDNQGFAHLFYVDGGAIRQRIQAIGWWLPTITVGSGTAVAPAVTEAGHLLLAVQSGNTAVVYLGTGGGWQQRAAYTPPNTLYGPPQISSAGQWAYLTWVIEDLDPDPTDWPRRRPEYKPAAPFVNRIHEGSNAQQYFTTYGIHLAGVYQQLSTTPGASLTVSAHAMAWSCDGDCPGATPNDPNPPSSNPANMRMQVCLDPTGGVDVLSPAVVCSSPHNPLNTWQEISVSATASSGAATLFLKSNPDMPRRHNDVYWDTVTVNGGSINNGDFEADFPEWQGISQLKIASGWTPFYIEDPPAGVQTGRYAVRMAMSSDGGFTWSGDQPVAINAQFGNQKTGSIGPYAYPAIDLGGERVAVLFLYNEGDPTPTGGMIRYGRPSVVVCGLGQTACTPGDSGARLVPSNTNRPAVTLRAHAFNNRVIVAWDAYHGSYATARDVFAVSVLPRRLRVGGSQ